MDGPVDGRDDAVTSAARHDGPSPDALDASRLTIEAAASRVRPADP